MSTPIATPTRHKKRGTSYEIPRPDAERATRFERATICLEVRFRGVRWHPQPCFTASQCEFAVHPLHSFPLLSAGLAVAWQYESLYFCHCRKSAVRKKCNAFLAIARRVAQAARVNSPSHILPKRVGQEANANLQPAVYELEARLSTGVHGRVLRLSDAIYDSTVSA